MSGDIALLPYMPPWHGQGKIYMFTVKNTHVICYCKREMFFHTCRNLGYAIDMSSESGFFYMLPFSYLRSIIYDSPF
jgi:hypothetical protein